MTYKPIPEPRRRELAPRIPELTRKFKSWLGGLATGESEIDFWQRELPRASPEERVWLLRQARNAAGCIDALLVTNYGWPGCCMLTGRKAAREHWPLEPIPDEYQPTPEGPLVDGNRGSPENLTYVAPKVEPTRTVGKSPALAAPFGASFIVTQRMEIETNRLIREMLEKLIREMLEKPIHPPTSIDWVPGVGNTHIASPSGAWWFGTETFRFINPAVPTHSKEKHTMNQATSVAKATPFNHASLSVDTSKIVEVKTFVYGTDTATLNDDDLLSHVERLTGAIEHLELLNSRTPLAKLVAKIAQLKDAKAKIVDLLGGADAGLDD